jgi:Toprim domain
MDLHQSQAERIARALGGAVKNGDGWRCRCPAHDGKDSNLTIRERDGVLRVKCWSHSCATNDILEAIRRRGFGTGESTAKPKPAVTVMSSANALRAVVLWQQGRSIWRTLGEKHLAGRGLTLPLGAEMRFLGRCPRSGRDAQPAIIWPMRDILRNEIRAIQRRFLLPDGAKDGKAESLGPTTGTVWKTNADEDVTTALGLAEGYSDALAAVNDGWEPIWTTCGAGGMAVFPVLPAIESLTLFVQNDEPAQDAAKKCAARWRAAGREVRLAPTPTGFEDFADLKAVPS